VLLDVADQPEDPRPQLILVLRLDVLEVVVAGVDHLVDADLALRRRSPRSRTSCSE